MIGGTLVLSGCGGGSDSSQPPVPPPPPPPDPVSRDPGVYLLAGQLGGFGVLEGKGPAARLRIVNQPLNIMPNGLIYARTEGGALAIIDQDGKLSYGRSPPASCPYYVADANGHLHAFGWGFIYRQSPAGWTLIAGHPDEAEAGYQDGLGTSARMGNIFSPVLAADGSLYFIDTGTSVGLTDTMTIRKLTSSGQIVTVAGQPGVEPGWKDGQGSAARFAGLRQLIPQADGSIVAFDGGFFRRVTLDGNVSSISNLENYEARAFDVGSLVQASATSFYGLQGNRIVLLTLDGTISAIAGVREENKVIWDVKDGVGEDVRFERPRSMVGLQGGDLLVAEGLAALRRITPQTKQVTSWVGANLDKVHKDGVGSSARFNGNMDGVVTNTKGTVYVLDFDPDTIRTKDAQQVARKITADGVVSTLPGRLSSGWAAFVADANDNLYYWAGSAIMQLKADGTLAVFAGSVQEKGFADGPASNARFASPRHLCFDQTGNLWVIDVPVKEYDPDSLSGWPGSERLLRIWYGQTIRRIAPDGSVTTHAGTPGQVIEQGFERVSPLWQLWTGIKVDTLGRVYLFGTNAGIHRIDGAGGQPIEVWGTEGTSPRFAQVSVSPSGQIFGSYTVPYISGGGSVIYTVGPGRTLRVVAGSEGPNQLGVRLGALPGALNVVSSLHAQDDRTLIVSSEGAILRVSL